MLVNLGTSPNADERKCAAKVIIQFNDNANTTDIVLENEISSVRVIAEYQIVDSYTDSRQPSCELSVTFDNSLVGFDLLDKNNMYYKLSDTSTIELYLSTTDKDEAISYVKKAKLFFSSMKFSGDNATITSRDPFAFEFFKDDYPHEATDEDDRTARGITNYCLKKHTPFDNHCECVIDDSINDRLKFDYEDFEYSTGGFGTKTECHMTDQVAIPYMGAKLSKVTGIGLRLLVNENGNIEYRQVSNDVVETIGKADYIEYQVGTIKAGSAFKPSITFTDRGNILRQPADVVSFCDENKTYKLEICKISLHYKEGQLSGENTGLILAS